MELIEQVQRRITKRLHGLSNYTYDEHLTVLNWQNLQSFRSHYVLIILALVCINAGDFCEFRVSNTPLHSYKLYQ